MDAINGRLAPTPGTCMVMGTASTMACLAEALGMALPGSAAIPATHADRIRCAEQSGAAAVAAIGQADRLPPAIMTEAAFRNAQVVLQAIGGSTNGLVHLAAIAGRLGMKLDLDAFDRLGREVPVLIDLKPTGDHYMEHFHWSGGVPRLMRELRGLLDPSARTVLGSTLGDAMDAAEDVPGQTVIRPRDEPRVPHRRHGGAARQPGAGQRGDQVRRRHPGAAAARPGRAVVFDGVDDMAARIDDPDLDVTADDVLVLRYAGPRGAPGMPEAGYLPIPKKLARAGVKDMVRMSDARMSGTAFGTIVLHMVPEAAVGGPLALVRTGDRIRLDVAGRGLTLLVDEAELALRRAAWTPPTPPPGADRGYLKLYRDSVTQADQGCDFDFLQRVGPA